MSDQSLARPVTRLCSKQKIWEIYLVGRSRRARLVCAIALLAIEANVLIQGRKSD